MRNYNNKDDKVPEYLDKLYGITESEHNKEAGDESITLSKKEYLNLVEVVTNGHEKEKELIETIHRLMGVINQQQGSTETIEKSVGRFLDGVEADYLHSGVMDAVNRGLFNSRIISINSTYEPLYTIEQVVEMLRENPDLKVWSSKLFWSATDDEIVALLTDKQGLK